MDPGDFPESSGLATDYRIPSQTGSVPPRPTSVLMRRTRQISGATSPRDDTLDTPTRESAEISALRAEIQGLREENARLQRQTQEAEQRSDVAERKFGEAERRVFRAEAEYSVMQKSLEEASRLLQESVTGTSFEDEGVLKIQELSRKTDTRLEEVSALERKLQESQTRLQSLERDMRERRRISDELQRDLGALLASVRSTTGESVDKEAIGEDISPELVRAAQASLVRLRLQLETGKKGPGILALPSVSFPGSTPQSQNALLKERILKLEGELAEMRGRQATSGATEELTSTLRELAAARAEAVRLREEKSRLLQAVKAAAHHRRMQDQGHMRERLLRSGAPEDSDSDVHSDVDSFTRQHKDVQHLQQKLIRMSEELGLVREERDRIVDQLVASRAAAEAAELLKIDTQDERNELLRQLEDAHAKHRELNQRLGIVRTGPLRKDCGSQTDARLDEPRYNSGLDDFADLEDGFDVMPVVPLKDTSSAAPSGDGGAQAKIDEYAFEQLKYTLEQVQQLLERSDAQLLEEKENSRIQGEQSERMRCKLEELLKDVAQLQQERDQLCIERDQWAQAARDADDARRRLLEHIQSQTNLRGTQNAPGANRSPQVNDLLRDKAELQVQIDILKERLADSTEELEGARRELVVSLETKGHLSREQDEKLQMGRALQEAKDTLASMDDTRRGLINERDQLSTRLKNAELSRQCSIESLKAARDETSKMQQENERKEARIRDLSNELNTFASTNHETRQMNFNLEQQLEVFKADKQKVMVDKQRDLLKIETLTQRLSELRLANDRETMEEREQLRQEREFDALMLADRMKELDEAKTEMGQVKSKSLSAIRVLKVSLQNALMHMKALGDEFEVERAELKEKIGSLQRQVQEKTAEAVRLQAEAAALRSRSGTDELLEKVKELESALDTTKSSFSQQTQHLEEVKAQLRSARKQLQENANFKELFDAATEHTDTLTLKNRDLSKENRDLRMKLDIVTRQEQQKQQKEEDEITQALREQIQALQQDLKREKDLRLRMKEEANRVKKEHESYERANKAFLDEANQRAEEKQQRLDELTREHKEALNRFTSERSGLGQHQLSHRATMLQCEVEEKKARIEELAMALSAKQQTITTLQDSLASSQREGVHVIDAVRRIQTVADSYCPEIVGEQELSHRHSLSHMEAAEAALLTVRNALETLSEARGNASATAKEDTGRLEAEYRGARSEMSARLAQAEEARLAAEEELARFTGDAKFSREEVARLQQEVIRLSDLSASSESLQRRNDSLQQELDDLLNERDSLLVQLREDRTGESAEVVSLKEASEMATNAMRGMKRDLDNAKQEAEAANKAKESLRVSLEELKTAFSETQKALAVAQRTVDDAKREREEAAQSRDRAGRERRKVEEERDAVREELRRAIAERSKLQATSQDLDGLNRLVDDSRDELGRTKEMLNAARAELSRNRAQQEEELAAALEERRLGWDAELREALREKELLKRKAESAARDRIALERSVDEAREKEREDQRQLELERRASAEKDEQILELRQLVLALQQKDPGDQSDLGEDEAEGPSELVLLQRENTELKERLAEELRRGVEEERNAASLEEKVQTAMSAAREAEARRRAAEAEVENVNAELADARRELDEGRALMLSLVGPPEGVEQRR